MSLKSLKAALAVLAAIAGLMAVPPARADTIDHRPWKNGMRALVVDAYEYNQLDLPFFHGR